MTESPKLLGREDDFCVKRELRLYSSLSLGPDSDTIVVVDVPNLYKTTENHTWLDKLLVDYFESPHKITRLTTLDVHQLREDKSRADVLYRLASFKENYAIDDLCVACVFWLSYAYRKRKYVELVIVSQGRYQQRLAIFFDATKVK